MATSVTRRGVLFGAAAGLLLPGCASLRNGRFGRETGGEVGAGEDLMREHAVLARLLLVYDESAQRLEGRRRLPVDALGRAAGLVRRFVEDYHERLEEEHLFPRFERAGSQAELVEVLRRQHERGRELTSDVLGLATAKGLARPADRRRLASALRAYVRMYRPHAAREDTVLFPALHALVDAEEYRELGAVFERREHQLLGDGGFAAVVGQVAEIEKALGTHDLSRFTPA